MCLAKAFQSRISETIQAIQKHVRVANVLLITLTE